MKSIKFNVDNAFDLRYIITTHDTIYINNREVIQRMLFSYYSKLNRADSMGELLEEFYDILTNRRGASNYSDEDINRAVSNYEEALNEAYDLWEQAESKIAKLIEEELFNLDEDAIEGCKLEYLGGGICQLSSENLKVLKEGSDNIDKVISGAVGEKVYNFIEKYLSNEDIECRSRINNTEISAIISFRNDTGYRPEKSSTSSCRIISSYELLDNAENDYGEVLNGYFYIPKIFSKYNDNAVWTHYSPGAPYGSFGVSGKFAESLLEDSDFSEQMKEIKEMIVQALENYQSDAVKNWNGIVNRAKALSEFEITNRLAGYINKVGKDLNNDDADESVKELSKLDSLYQEYLNTPEEVFGNDFMRIWKDPDHSSAMKFSAVGWTQERIDEINSRLSRIIDEAQSIYDNMPEIEPNVIQIRLGDGPFVQDISFYELANYSKAKKYEEIVKALEPALDDYMLKFKDSKILEASREMISDDENCGQVLGVEL